ncbi:MAG: AraC family transcriptional regulator [Oscillibacter sp.]|nr:AraC family transcriptional regulator [Oscillibacter sp.]
MSTQQYIIERPSAPESEGSGRVLLRYITRAHYSEEWNSTLHTHARAELFFITGGHGVFQVWQDRFPVAINDLVVINAGIPHTETSQQGSPMEYVVLGVDGLETMTDISGCALLHLAAEQEAVTACLRMMVQEIRVQQAGCDEICQNLLEIILLRLRRREDFSLSSTPSGPRSSRNCDLVRRYIDNHFKENLTLDQLAKMAHVSKYHLSHTFQEEFHISPISYLIARRIQESRFLLRETDHSISQIAQILGFSSLSYFSQSFRRLEGISPIEFRRRYHKKSGEPGS